MMFDETDHKLWGERNRLEKAEGWAQWRKEIPYLRMSSDWEVQVIPPMAGAMVRFCARRGQSHVSVYMDTLYRLDLIKEPHWEVYPSSDGDVERFMLKDSEGLLQAIHESFDAQDLERQQEAA